jgi:hypothetical protein
VSKDQLDYTKRLLARDSYSHALFFTLGLLSDALEHARLGAVHRGDGHPHFGGHVRGRRLVQHKAAEDADRGGLEVRLDQGQDAADDVGVVLGVPLQRQCAVGVRELLDHLEDVIPADCMFAPPAAAEERAGAVDRDRPQPAAEAARVSPPAACCATPTPI